MKVKFKLEIYDADNKVDSIVSGSADSNDIDLALEYLLKLKQDRHTASHETH